MEQYYGTVLWNSIHNHESYMSWRCSLTNIYLFFDTYVFDHDFNALRKTFVIVCELLLIRHIIYVARVHKSYMYKLIHRS